jgi:ABC-type branched-subunit amino acid transport system substrate-binding protein
MARSRWLVCVALFMVLASACGRSGDKEQGGGDSTTTAPGKASGTFGDLEDVCGPGTPAPSSAIGVTDTEIHAAVVSDPNQAARPGLDQELFDAAKVFAAWCNDAGGINGRKVVVDYRDAKLGEFKQRVIESCRDDFMMVGGGAVFDDTGQEDRLRCLLPTIAGFVVTPQARGADLTVQPVPNPLTSVSVAAQRYVAKRFPASVDHVGYLTGNIATTKVVNDQKLEAAPTLGFKTVYTGTYNAFAEPTWTPFAQALKSNGVRGLIYTGEPENAAKLLQALAEIGYQLDWFVPDANHIDSKLIDIGGAAVKNVFIAGSVVPYSLAKQNPATQQYLDLFKKYLPDGKNKAYLGYQGFSAWLLFAQAAKACGSDLTRKCVYDKASKVTEWTGGGLHAPTNPSSNSIAECVLVSEATPDGFVIPNDFEKTDGIFNCNAANAYKLKNDYGKGVTLADVGLSLADLK